MGPRALAWLKEHWRPVAIAAAVLVAFVAGRASAPAPTITAHQVEQLHQQAAGKHQAQLATAAQQTTAVARTEKRDESKHEQIHKVVHVLPSGERTITTDTTFDDQVHVEEAQQLQVVIAFQSLAQLAGESSSSADLQRETSVVQTSAQPPRYRLVVLAGLSMHGPVYGGQASVRVLGPVWLGAWGLTAPAGGLSVGVEW